MRKRSYILINRPRKKKKDRIENEIKTMIAVNGIVVSKARTAREICSLSNYYRSVELPVCGKGKLL